MAENAKKDRILPIVFAIIIVYFLVSIYLYWNDYVKVWIEEDYTDEYYFAFTFYEYWGMAIWGMVTAICFFSLVKVFGKDTPAGKVWLILGLGIVFWDIADWIYTQHFYTTEEFYIPDPNPARIAYFIGYILMIIGLIKQIRITPIKLEKSAVTKYAIVTLVICIVLMIYVTIPSLLESVDENMTSFGLVQLVAFAVADLVIIFLAILLVLLFKGGEFAKSWLIIALGFLVLASFDMLLYALENVYPDTYYYITDFLYYIFYWILALGALHLRKMLL